VANLAAWEGAETQAWLDSVSFMTFYVIFSIDPSNKMPYYVIDWRNSMKIEGIQARINQNGRIVVPAVIRRAMGLNLGDGVVMSLEDGVLRIEPQPAKIRRIQTEFEPFADPESLASDELIAERREEARQQEARRETEEWLG
jgi:AbrB family looped-hinge helix DNA binding protein